MTDIKIITHPGAFGASASDDMIDAAMRLIGVGFAQPDEWASKYGTDYENEVFMIHRFCWCEGSDCPWCMGCDCPVGKGASKGKSAPNFWFKPSGFKLWWYKYIGRDMEFSDECLPGDFLKQIFDTHPTGMTVEQAFEKLARCEEENSKIFAKIFADLNSDIP